MIRSANVTSPLTPNWQPDPKDPESPWHIRHAVPIRRQPASESLPKRLDGSFVPPIGKAHALEADLANLSCLSTILNLPTIKEFEPLGLARQ